MVRLRKHGCIFFWWMPLDLMASLGRKTANRIFAHKTGSTKNWVQAQSVPPSHSEAYEWWWTLSCLSWSLQAHYAWPYWTYQNMMGGKRPKNKGRSVPLAESCTWYHCISICSKPPIKGNLVKTFQTPPLGNQGKSSHDPIFSHQLPTSSPWTSHVELQDLLQNWPPPRWASSKKLPLHCASHSPGR